MPETVSFFCEIFPALTESRIRRWIKTFQAENISVGLTSEERAMVPPLNEDETPQTSSDEESTTQNLIEKRKLLDNEECDKQIKFENKATMATDQYEESSETSDQVCLDDLTPKLLSGYITKRRPGNQLPFFNSEFKDMFCRYCLKHGNVATKETCDKLKIKITPAVATRWMTAYNDIPFTERHNNVEGKTIFYTKEFKVKVVKYAIQTNATEATRKFSKECLATIHSSRIHQWIRKYKEHGIDALENYHTSRTPRVNEKEINDVFICKVLRYYDKHLLQKTLKKVWSQNKRLGRDLIQTWLKKRSQGYYQESFKSEPNEDLSEIENDILESTTTNAENEDSEIPFATEMPLISKSNKRKLCKRKNEGQDRDRETNNTVDVDAQDNKSKIKMRRYFSKRSVAKTTQRDLMDEGTVESVPESYESSAENLSSSYHKNDVGEFAYNNGFLAASDKFPGLDRSTIYEYIKEYEKSCNNLLGNTDKDVGSLTESISPPLSFKKSTGPNVSKDRKTSKSSSQLIATSLLDYPIIYDSVISSLLSLKKSKMHLTVRLIKTLGK